MPEGFKLLDAYVEVTASGKGLAEKVAQDVEAESPRAAQRAGSSFGTSMLGGFKGILGAGAVAGIVSSFGYAITNQVQNVVGSAFSFAKGAVVDFNSQLENSTIGFTTMLGSAQKAQVFLSQLQDFAKTTPFEFGNLVSNAQQMMGMGIAAKDVIPDLRALGDSVAAMGGNAQQVDQVTLAFDQMASKGTLDMGNMNQLLQGGVPSALKILAAAYHTTTGQMIDMISTGKVQASVALPALVKGIEKGTSATAALGGMMDKQSATFAGAMSNISDALNQTIAKAFQPFFKTLEKGAQSLASFVSTKRFQDFVTSIGSGFSHLMKPMHDFFDGFINGVDSIHSNHSLVASWGAGVYLGLANVGRGVQDFWKGFSRAIANSVKTIPSDLKKAFSSLDSSAKTALPNLEAFAKTTAPTLITMFDKLIKLTPKVGESLGKLSPVLGVVGYVFNNFVDKAINPTIDKISDLLDIFNGKKNAVQTSYTDAVTGKLGTDWQILAHVASSVGTVIGLAMASIHMNTDHALEFIRGFVTSAGKIFGSMVSFVGDMDRIGAQIIGGLVAGINSADQAVVDAVTGLINLIPGWARKLLGIASPSKVFHLIGTQVGEGLHLGLLGSVDQIKTTAGKMVDAIRGAFTGAKGAAMVGEINTVAKSLERLSTARDKATSNLSNARSNLSSIIGDRASFGGQVADSVRSSADITSLYGATTGAAMTTLNGVAYQPSYTSSSGLSGVSANLKNVLASTKRFTANLAKLVKMGIDPVTYGQLVQAGPMAGLALSDQLVSDPAGFRQIVDLEKQISYSANRLGIATRDQTYAPQVAAAQRAVVADQRQVNQINVTMVVEAKKIDEVQKLINMVNRVKQTARKG